MFKPKIKIYPSPLKNYLCTTFKSIFDKKKNNVYETLIHHSRKNNSFLYNFNVKYKKFDYIFDKKFDYFYYGLNYLEYKIHFQILIFYWLLIF